jgi:ribonuclease HI
MIVDLYTDGGVILKNPSPYGGTWAWVGVDAEGNIVREDSGFVPAPEGRVVTNNHTEQMAIVKALEAMEAGWTGRVLSDSQLALGRVFLGWKEKNLPENLKRRTAAVLTRVNVTETVLLKGHPTKKDLEQGYQIKRVKYYQSGPFIPSVAYREERRPVSIYNVRCDELCNLAKRAFDYGGIDVK